MNISDWKKLQNGSDIRGVAMEGIAGEQVNLTAEVAGILGRSLAKWLDANTEGPRRVAIGRDPRLSGQELMKAFTGGLTSMGYDVIDCGLASTPAMFMTTTDPKLNVKGAVMMTASHLPWNRNGLKFFTAGGGFDRDDISKLLKIAGTGKFTSERDTGKLSKYNYISDYADHLCDIIRKGANSAVNYEKPLNGTKILVDAGNGAGGFFAEKILVPLGADISGSQFLDPDGHFPNHVPNPEDREAMDSVCRAVLKEKAELGIIFDTDVDRAALVDSEGNAINRNELIALISSVILNKHPGSVIVTDSITSTGLKWFIEEHLGGVHHRFKRGYKNVINESIRLNEEGRESWLAIETSGHAALKENMFLDDGAFLVARLLIQMARMKQEGKTLVSLIDKLQRPAEEKEFRLSIHAEDFTGYGKQVLEGLEAMIHDQPGWTIEKPNYEGIRVNCNKEDEKGWFLLRMSLHDPVMPLNVESSLPGGVGKISEKLKKLLEGFGRLKW